MIYTIFLTFIIVTIAVALLGVKVFFTAKGTFPNFHIGDNSKLKDKGILCAKSQDLEERNKQNIFEISTSKKKQ